MNQAIILQEKILIRIQKKKNNIAKKNKKRDNNYKKSKNEDPKNMMQLPLNSPKDNGMGYNLQNKMNFDQNNIQNTNVNNQQGYYMGYQPQNQIPTPQMMMFNPQGPGYMNMPQQFINSNSNMMGYPQSQNMVNGGYVYGNNLMMNSGGIPNYMNNGLMPGQNPNYM